MRSIVAASSKSNAVPENRLALVSQCKLPTKQRLSLVSQSFLLAKLLETSPQPAHHHRLSRPSTWGVFAFMPDDLWLYQAISSKCESVSCLPSLHITLIIVRYLFASRCLRPVILLLRTIEVPPFFICLISGKMFSLSVAATLLASTLISTASARPSTRSIGSTSTSPKNVVYWGQGPSQNRLNTFCTDSTIDIIPIGFVNGLPSQNGGWPAMNFGNACDADEYFYDGSTKTGSFTNCRKLVPDVAACQGNQKKIFISIGGDSPGFQLGSQAEAVAFATQLWQIFGPKSSDYTGPRPFGAASVVVSISISSLEMDHTSWMLQTPSEDSSQAMHPRHTTSQLLLNA
jgi:hypothetical protein